ncbi:cell division protein SepF [Candidatus Woesearchaeota archaeon]|nr:cell division protein SepF [Candidatus Woesearchaeota archaeon]MBW3013957.1 cell division protein SepF [Candidatus Woesearchaeota archaeon]
MKETFLNIKNQLSRRFGNTSRQTDFEEPVEEEYVELGPETTETFTRNKITVRPFVMEEFEDIKPILDALRQGMTIALINIAPLKEKDIVELKRAVNKLKKTCDAIDGDIAGFGEDYIVATPEFASVFRHQQMNSADDL